MPSIRQIGMSRIGTIIGINEMNPDNDNQLPKETYNVV